MAMTFTEMDKVIFLDIDGPLLPAKQWFHPTNAELRREYGDSWWKEINKHPDFKDRVVMDPVAVEAFNLWQELGDAKIVLATNWRRWIDTDDIVYILERNGMRVNLHDDFKTPAKFTSNRMQEIGMWMDDNPDTTGIIVDDDADLMRYAKWFNDPDVSNDLDMDSWQRKLKLVEVDYSNGITMKNMTAGNQWLGIEHDQVAERVFGVKPLTDEEKAERDAALDMLMRCAI